MANLSKYLISFLMISVGLFVSMSFIMKDKTPDYTDIYPEINHLIKISKINTDNRLKGCFKSNVLSKKLDTSCNKALYYGYDIVFEDHLSIDKIRVGITKHNTSKIEIWKNNLVIKTHERDFLTQINDEQDFTLSIEFYDQGYPKYHGESQISMRAYHGTGFLGDIASINMKLNEWGDLPKNKNLSLFKENTKKTNCNNLSFNNLKIWNEYLSYD